MKTSTIVIAVIALFILVVGGIYSLSRSGTSGQTEPVASEGYKVEIKNSAFNPKVINIKEGTTVEWTNKDSKSHTIVSDSEGEMDSPKMEQDDKFEHLFAVKGTYSYYCGIHPSMKGTVVVE